MLKQLKCKITMPNFSYEIPLGPVSLSYKLQNNSLTVILPVTTSATLPTNTVTPPITLLQAYNHHNLTTTTTTTVVAITPLPPPYHRFLCSIHHYIHLGHSSRCRQPFPWSLPPRQPSSSDLSWLFWTLFLLLLPSPPPLFLHTWMVNG